MTPARTFALTLALAVSAGAALRLPGLSHRPMHTDEAVHAVKFADLWLRGRYVYDPHDYHGPTLYFATWPIVAASGAEDFAATAEWQYRLAPALAGVLAVAAVGLLAPALGYRAAGVSAVLLAVSPGCVFFSRYYIQEMLLVLWVLLTLGCAWRYTRNRRLGWAIATGLAVGLTHATKETCIVLWFAMVVAVIGAWLWGRLGRGPIWKWRRHLRPWPLLAGAIAAALVSALLFSDLFRRPVAILDSVTTYANYFQRSGGAGRHEWPWWYYLRELGWFQADGGPVWTEGLILLLALIGAAAIVGRKHLRWYHFPMLLRVVLIYAAVSLTLFSAIRYKTPWSILPAQLGAVLLAGVGAAALWERFRATGQRAVLAALLLVGVGHLAWQAQRASFAFAADNRSPYVYAMATEATLDLADRVRQVAEVSQQGLATPVQMVMPEHDYWPLPWYLRDMENLGGLDHVPDGPMAPIVITSPDMQAAVDARIAETHNMPGYYEVRHGVFWQVYVERDLWLRAVSAARAEGRSP